MTAPLSLEEARRDVRAKKAARTRAESRLADTLGCSLFVHPNYVVGCTRCETYRAAWEVVLASHRDLEAAQRRLEAVESQIPEVQWIGGER